MSKKPLEGIKVADFTWVWTGPTSTKVLADFGATVLRIESKVRPDVWRIQPPFKDDSTHQAKGGRFAVKVKPLQVSLVEPVVYPWEFNYARAEYRSRPETAPKTHS